TVLVVSDRPGLASVRVMGILPEGIQVDDSASLSVRFGEPITGIKLDVSAGTLSLLETATVGVSLIDEQNLAHKADYERDGRLVAESVDAGQGGRGRFDQETIEIDKGHSRMSTTFRPYWPGTIQIRATVDNLPDATWPKPIMITLPV